MGKWRLPKGPESSSGTMLNVSDRVRLRAKRLRGRGEGVAGVCLSLLFMLSVGSCGPEKNEKGSVKVYRATRRHDLVGGPAALAEVGDFILENDKIRLAILQPGNSVGPGIFGGSLIDADLNRPQASYQAGHGIDQFAEMFPSVNLLVPNPTSQDVVTGPNWGRPSRGESGEGVSRHLAYRQERRSPTQRVVCRGVRLWCGR